MGESCPHFLAITMSPCQPSEFDEDLRQRFEAARVGGAEARVQRAVEVEHAEQFGSPRSSGTTISEFDAESQAMWPGKACTSSTSTVSRRAAAVPHTPLPMAMRTQAGLPWNGPEHQLATLI